ncbi:MAG: HRDC domain-containing protein [Planctomycetes bacterium]|nr:HRDC domain-containing protein [Planctomycetota bacterium]MCA8935241.1 HRDC domain-containing protein [Planctomycetota bacterium]
MPETEIVAEPERFSEVIDELMNAPRVALDIESDGFYNYRDRVCIVTLSSEEADFIIDTIALGEAARDMQRLVNREGVPVLMHSGQNDVLALKRDYAFEFELVHDTAVVAMLLGLQHTGLAAIVQSYLGIPLEKELQRHDWSRRPIEPEHVHYLINDTKHLFKMHDLMMDELAKLELMDEYEIECRAVAEAEPRPREFDPERFRKIKGHGDLSDKQRGVLKVLYAWRDELASKLDRAPFRVTGDYTLLDMARRLPRDLDALAQIRGVGEWMVQDHGSRLLGLIEQGLSQPVGVRPPKRRPTGPLPPRMDQQQRDRLGELKRWREKEAEARGVGIQAVLPTAVLKDLIFEPPKNPVELARIPRVGTSRAERYGESILGILDA